MRINLDLPDWNDLHERRIDILAGIEQIAYKLPWENVWHVKVGRCSMCGKCCAKVECDHLTVDNQCDYAGMRPYLCCTSTPHNIPDCTIRFVEVPA